MSKRTDLVQSMASRQTIIDGLIARNKKTKKELQRIIDKEKAELKPELRVGEYGTKTTGPASNDFVVIDIKGPKYTFLWRGEGNMWQTTWDKFYDNPEHKDFNVTGSVFDDIAAKTETLDRFEMESIRFCKVVVSSKKDGVIILRGEYDGGHEVHISPEIVDEFTSNLQKVANGIKQKAGTK